MNTSTTTPPEAIRQGASGGSPWVDSQAKPTIGSRLRGANRRRSVPHLLVGTVLVLSCAAAFLAISLNSDRQRVLALARAVTVGHGLTTADLRQVEVTVGSDVRVVHATDAATVLGKTMSTSLPAGALLTPDVVGAAPVPPAGQGVAALSLAAGRFPPEIGPGAHVSVIINAGQPNGSVAARPPDPLSAWEAVVTGVRSPANEQTTVVSVELAEAAARQVAAAPAGQVSLVLLSAGGR